MIKHQYEQGILIVHFFSTRQSYDYLRQELIHLMDDARCTARAAVANFHYQFDWEDYFDFIAENESLASIHAVGIIVKDDEKVDSIEWRSGILRSLGIDTRVFRNIEEMTDWAESKLPERYFTKNPV